MFQSQYFLFKKGPLSSIWVAAYCLKRLHRDQIVQTDISSSVDKILIDEWPTVTYRILACLLLGVVRIYSKKVEFVLHDCRKIIDELNKFVGKKKAVPFREIVHARDFSVTLPERYELDAFNVEYADDDDVNNAHIAKKEDITITGSFRYDKYANCSVSKYHRDVAVQEETFRTVSKTSAATFKLKGCSSTQNPPESPEEMETCSTALVLVENRREFKLGTSLSQSVRSFAESVEEFREVRFSREECLDIEMFYQDDKESYGISESPIIIQSVNVEHSAFIRMMQTENNVIFHSGIEVETDTVERNHDITMLADNYDDGCTEEKEANFTVETSPDLHIPSINHNYFSVENEGSSIGRSPDPVIALDDHTSSDLHIPSTNHNYFSVENEGSSIGRSPDPVIPLDDHTSVTSAKPVIIKDFEMISHSDCSTPLTSLKEKLPLKFQTTPDDQGVTATKKVIMADLERVSHPETSTPRTSKKKKLPLKVETTPDLKISAVKEPGSTELMAVRTPANKEPVRKSNKRKCIYDDVTVLSNKALKHNLDDTSDLVRKRKKVPHTRLALWRMSWINDLPQKFMEPCSISAAIVMDPKDIQRKSNDVDQAKTVITVETVEEPENQAMAVSPPRGVSDGLLTIAPVITVETVEEPENQAMEVSPPRGVSDGLLTIAPVITVETVEEPENQAMAVSPPRGVSDGLLTIAPGTPVRCSTSTRAFVTPRAADSDGEGPFLSFRTGRKESPCQLFENARRDFAGDSVEEIALDLIDKDMGEDEDHQELDGWSTRTRNVAMWLHQVVASDTKGNEAKNANLSQILDGKLRKESARVFYEILVLKSGEYVNVSQEGPYKDILVQETRNMERKLAKCSV